MQENNPPLAKLAAAFAAVYLIWGSTYLGIRYAIETIPPFLLGGMRFLTAGSMLCLWARSQGVTARKEESWRASLIVGFLLFMVGNGGVVVAEKWVPSGIAALMVSTTPFWMALFEWVAPGGERPRLQVIIGILIGFCGVLLLVDFSQVRPGTGVDATGVDATGAGILILSSISWSAGSLYARRVRLSPSPIMTSGMQMLSGSVFLAAASLLTGELGSVSADSPSTRSLLAFVYLTLFGSIVAFTAYSWLVKNTTPSRLATYAFVNPAVAVFLGWAVGGETMTPRVAAAMALIVAAVIVITSSSAAQRSRVQMTKPQP